MQNNPELGAFNLLKNCLNVQVGDSVLLVLEPTEALYDKNVTTVMEECLKQVGAITTIVTPPLITDPADFPDCVAGPMQRCDHTLFLSRIGDYVRFVPLPGSGSRATSYTFDSDMLGAPYATVNNGLMRKLQLKLEDEIMRAASWRIQCPLGSDISGEFSWPSLCGGQDDNLTVSLFPVATFKPVPCGTANGKVALSRWLMPGGASKLDNADIKINGVVHANVKDGNLESFDGARAEVEKINGHYDYVSQALGISRNRIHSWHAGINPQTRFDQSADEFLDLWCAQSFGSPKYLHFHTCGDEPPGEIAWSVFDPTIEIDETVYWDCGELVWLQRADNKALIESYEGAHYLFDPSLPIGIN